MPDLLDALPLTGPPELARGTVTVTMPMPVKTAGLVPEWVPEHRIVAMLDGEQRVVQRRFRGRFSLGWAGLSRAQFEALLGILEESSFTFTPRTAASGESETETLPDGTTQTLKQSFTVRCTSRIVTTKPVRIPTYDITVELETTGVVGDPLPTATPSSETPTIDPTTTTESRAGSIVSDCPTGGVIFISIGAEASVSLDDSGDEDLDAAEDADSIARFTRTLIESNGYAFDVSDIRFLDTASPQQAATPAQAFSYTVCPLECVANDASSPSDAQETAQRIIYFEVMMDEIASGTYEVEIDVDYDCTSLDVTLSFNMTKA